MCEVYISINSVLTVFIHSLIHSVCYVPDTALEIGSGTMNRAVVGSSQENLGETRGTNLASLRSETGGEEMDRKLLGGSNRRPAERPSEG